MQKKAFQFSPRSNCMLRSSLSTFSFYRQNIMDCSTGKRERRIVLMHFLLKSSQALAGKHDRTFLSFKIADLNNAQ